MPISQNKSYDFNYDPTRGLNLIFSKYNFSSQTLTTASNNGYGNGGIYIGLTSSLNINSNGICTNTLIEGNSSYVVSSSGNCDDHLTGGNAADKFICGEGTDVIKDYDSKEGDTILDKQNCEAILKSQRRQMECQSNRSSITIKEVFVRRHIGSICL